MSLAHQFIRCVTLYLEIGGAVALVFAFGVVSRVEPSAAGGSLLFRVLILPGATLLWPLVAVRSVRSLRRAP